MNNQFATQFLREDRKELQSTVADALKQSGASDEHLIKVFTDAVVNGIISLEKAIEIIQNPTIDEDGAAAAPASGGGSTTGGGVTNGAAVTGGFKGEQYFARTRRKKMEEDNTSSQICIPFEILDPVINAWPVDRQTALTALAKKYNIDVKFGKYGNNRVWYKEEVAENAPMLAHGKANISTYTKDGFTKAPGGEALKRQIKGVDVENLWDEEPTAMNESRAYSRFKKETSTRNESERMHEAVKMIHKKLEEVSKLLEFTSQMKEELSEGNDTLEYKHNTKKVFEKINKKVVEVYSKSKKLG